MPDLVPVKRALLSVSDKTGLVDFATALQTKYNVTLLSTGGTAKALRDGGLSVTDVSDVTGFPEMMDGRVKTLHPKVHGALLAVRDDPAHAAAMKEHGIEPIDLVVINLYPFEQTVAKPGVTFEEAIENIDIGGPSMIRSAAKNHAYVTVVTAPEQYEKVLGDLEKHGGSTCERHRRKLAQAAFARTHTYDGAIANYLAMQLETIDPKHGVSTSASERSEGPDAQPLPDTIELRLSKKHALRYGENPHQPAALYVENWRDSEEASVADAIQYHGKELSYINLLDADGALSCVKEFARPAACVVKHATPCGVAVGSNAADAFAKAYAGDPVAAFGGIVALNRPVDESAARVIIDGHKFLEVIVAPAYSPVALDVLKTRWKNVRLLEVGGLEPRDAAEVTLHKIVGGYLVQQRDEVGVVQDEWKSVGERAPTAVEMTDLKIAWLACKHVKSNAITIAKDAATVGIGGGQVDRVGAARIAIEKAGERAMGAVAASDAFFPFPDGPKLLIDAGVTAIVQPGGSVRDAETIALCDARGVALIFTGRRHFRH
ncbi:MAG TPA: bifunctional phosphoribosylaminoimidazolecarboxamide formyltransferase/IMP cyclohydrolase [Tepidisphaeraceae bacterium]|jgi:phosphoribosylaminoimidazolecarboxamide formyltransferase/IMP cyclohydrolase